MTVYVDDAVWRWRGKLWCHMTADTLDELHRFARKLGLKKAWFQDKLHHQHYDLISHVRQRAIDLGARALTSREYALNYQSLPIAADYVRLAQEVRADFALYGFEGAQAEIERRAVEYMADRALELPKRRRPRAVASQ
jgi:hypothetical protein